MLDNILSSYFSIKIFTCINDKRKLKIIKYNKKMQNNIGIKLIDYIFYSRKYIVYEENNKAKEYHIDNDQLIFEGDYKNGKRNGIGKEYDYNGELKFEGEFQNGKRNGNGKEYHSNGKLQFEGEYLNGEKNGKIKEYYCDGILKFEGEYLNGKPWNGKIYDKTKNNKINIIHIKLNFSFISVINV